MKESSTINGKKNIFMKINKNNEIMRIPVSSIT
jgi:hypothetical protein